MARRQSNSPAQQWRGLPAHPWLRNWGHWRHFRWSEPQLRYSSLHDSGTGEPPLIDEERAVQVQRLLNWWCGLEDPNRLLWIRMLHVHYVDGAFDGLSQSVQVDRVRRIARRDRLADTTWRRWMRQAVLMVGRDLGLNDAAGEPLTRR